MKRIFFVLSLFLIACAPDVSNYTPLMDPGLTTAKTQVDLSYCRDLVKKLPVETIFGSVASQIGTSSMNSWVTALELGTTSALESAAGATIVGAILGAKTGLTSRQDKAESQVRKCLSNYHAPLLED